MHEPSRRQLLVRASLAAAGAMTPRWAFAGAGPCAATPPQVEGPFYPRTLPADTDVDLTRVAGRPGVAKGAPVLLHGRLQDLDCRPLGGVAIDMWQANAAGRYDHPSDPNEAPLDPAFQGFARLVTAADGTFTVKTIKPGAYPASRRWTRPPHLHFKVAAEAHAPLVTQMYFEGEPLNDADAFIEELSAAERKQLVVPFETTPAGMEGTFVIVLGPRGRAGVTPWLPDTHLG